MHIEHIFLSKQNGVSKGKLYFIQKYFDAMTVHIYFEFFNFI